MAVRKLIEAPGGIPLDAINIACKADKDRKTGTIRNLHKWFAPMPPPALRALLFAALVDDPGDDSERERLRNLIADLVQNGGDLPSARVLNAARLEIERCWPNGVPPVLDPFCGGGSTLVEAQRLGCKTVASDLNPIPVLITKVLTDLLPRVAGSKPISGSPSRLDVNAGPFDGITEDVIHYARLVRERALERLDDAYPSAPDGATPIAWLWCRSVRCPNPACGIQTPLTTSWVLSKKRGDGRWIHPSVESGEVTFSIRGPDGTPQSPPKTGRGSNFICIACETPVRDTYVAAEGRAGRLGLRCTAVVETLDGKNRRYRSPEPHEEAAALSVQEVESAPDTPLAADPRNIWCVPYGLTKQSDLYTPRQLLLLDSIATEVSKVGQAIREDGGTEDQALAITALLGLCVGKMAQSNSELVRWKLDSRTGTGKPLPAFAEQTIKMSWDFAEPAPFADKAAGSWMTNVETAVRAIPYAALTGGRVMQGDARTISERVDGPVLVATDPPYFDQIVYADLSDYFYVWIRRALRPAFPDLFGTMATPKQGELIALASRHGGDKGDAKGYFIDGFVDTFRGLASVQTADAPILVVYAFKEQTSHGADDEVAPGWEAILEAVMAADLMVVGTWPIHGTGSSRMISVGANALATYVVLVCRPRPEDAPRATRSDLVRLLRAELSTAVAAMQLANIAPVDLAQAVIGPGMEIYSRHSAVVETDGSRVGVADALALINRSLAEALDEQEGDLDPDSRWAVTWYEQHAYDASSFGEADQLARAKGLAVDALVQAGIVVSGGNKVALIPRAGLPSDWDPRSDSRPTAWEAVQYLVRALLEGGESAAAELYAQLGSLADPARELTYRLYRIAEKAGRTEDAIAFNGLAASWADIAHLAEAFVGTALPVEPPEGLF